MAEIAIVSDTHLYHDASAVPEWIRERVRGADRVVHAGDFVTPDAVSFFADLADDLVAVRGNADVGVELPEVATFEAGSVAFGVTHPPGVDDASLDREAYDRAVVGTVREHAGPGAVAVAGHTHRVLDEVVGGTRLLNPGSATGALPADRPTMLVVEAAGGELDVIAHGPDGAWRP